MGCFLSKCQYSYIDSNVLSTSPENQVDSDSYNDKISDIHNNFKQKYFVAKLPDNAFLYYNNTPNNIINETDSF